MDIILSLREYDLFSEYCIAKHLGEGQNGVVKLVIKRGSSILYALKLIKYIGYSKNSQKVVASEILVCQSLIQNPIERTTRFYDVFRIEYNNTKYVGILMEYFVGVPIRYVCENLAPLDIKALLRLYREISKVMYQLHLQGIAHRDIGVQNILYNDDGICLIDFGYSCIPSNKNIFCSTTYGTPYYLPPEKNVKDYFASDMWGIGVLFLFLADGYKARNQYPFSKYKVNYPDNFVKDIIKGLLIQNPKKRTTAKELYDKLSIDKRAIIVTNQERIEKILTLFGDEEEKEYVKERLEKETLRVIQQIEKLTDYEKYLYLTKERSKESIDWIARLIGLYKSFGKNLSYKKANQIMKNFIGNEEKFIRAVEEKHSIHKFGTPWEKNS